MKKIISLFFSLFLCLAGWAQLQKFNTAMIRETADPRNFPAVYTVLVKGDIPKINAAAAAYGIRVNYSSGSIASVTGSLANLVYLANTSMVKRMEMVKNHLQLMNDTMRRKNNINPIQAGQIPLAMPYNGEGIIMGIIDSGVDYTAPDFKDSLGRSRILYIWDQNFSVAGNTPSPYGYGQEWDSSFFNNSTCPHNDLAFSGHGTHVAGVAGARGNANGDFRGVAPKVEFIVVAVNFYSSGPTISDAVDYIYAKAAALGRPCVINASVGDYYGSHDGKDLQSQLISGLLQTPGRLLVAAGGNAGSYKFHLGYNVTADTNFTWITNGNSQLNFQIYSDVSDFAGVNYTIGANHPVNFGEKGNIGFKNFSYSLGSVKSDTLFFNGNRIGIIQTTADTSDGVYALDVLITPDSLSYLWSFGTTGSGKFDAWNFEFKSSGLPTTGQYPDMVYYKSPDSLLTLVSGFQCLDEVITVANYLNMNSWYNVANTLITIPNIVNEISATSSHGPTRDGRQKPDITASGDQIFATAVLAMLPNLISGAPDAVSNDSMHVMGGGTSNSSPVVAGVGAMFLQQDPGATSWLFRQAVTYCAKQDTFTGTALPDEVWGYGKLDGFAAMTCITLGSGNSSMAAQGLQVYPNPFKSELNFSFGEDNGAGTICIYDGMGRKVAEQKAQLSWTVKVDLSGVADGIYFYSVTGEMGRIFSGKVVR